MRLERYMVQWLKVHTFLAKKTSLVPIATSGSSQVPVTPVLGGSNVGNALTGTYPKDTQHHTHTCNKNKILKV